MRRRDRRGGRRRTRPEFFRKNGILIFGNKSHRGDAIATRRADGPPESPRRGGSRPALEVAPSPGQRAGPVLRQECLGPGPRGGPLNSSPLPSFCE
jgi:hypothetical protein